MARQLFVRDNAQMDPFNLKTLAQYCLLGDPSVHPIAAETATGIPPGVAKSDSDRSFRAERRHKMKLAGDFLTRTKPTRSKIIATGKLPQTTDSTLSDIARTAGLRDKQTFLAYAVKGAPGAEGPVAKAKTARLRYLVTMGIPERDSTKNVNRGIAIVTKELGGRIMGYRIYHQR